MKKLLALVLALVMTLSLCTISNAAYSDAADIDYTEAVEVMSALGILEGSDGKFNPDGILTREQAAKIITYMVMGQKAADKLTTSEAPFADVAANRWSAAFVAYCKSTGIIAGVGDNKFDPTAELTGLAFAKMVLCATGYDQSVEKMVGENWAINTAKLVIKTELDENVSVSSAKITRQEAAQLALDAMQLKLRTYEEGLNIVGTNLSVTGGGKYTESTKTMLKDTFGVTLNTSTNDKFGRPAVKYTRAKDTAKDWAKVDLTFAKKAVLTYTEAVKSATVYTDLALSADVNAATYTATTEALGVFAVAKNDKTHTIGGNGTVTEVYKFGDSYLFVLIPSTAAEIAVKSVAATKTAGAYTKYTIGGHDYKIFSTVVDKDADKDTAVLNGEVANKDYVTYYVVDGKLYVTPTTTISGTYTALNSKGVYTIGGQSYEKSAAVETLTATANATTEQTFYVDSYGYLLKVKDGAADPVCQVIYVDTVQTLDGNKVKTNKSVMVVLTDGTVATLTAASDASLTVGSLYSYSTNSKGITTFTSYSVPAKMSSLSSITTKGATLNALYGNAATKFVVVNYVKDDDGVRVPDGTVTVYTGINNVPSYVGLSKTVALDTASTADTVADIVFVCDDVKAVESDKNVYLLGTYVDTTDGRVYDAFVKGELTTVTVADVTKVNNTGASGGTPVVLAKGMYSEISGKADNYTKAVAAAPESYDTVQNNGNLFFTGADADHVTYASKKIADDVAVYVIDTADETVTTLTGADLTTAMEGDYVYTVLKTGDSTVVETVYILVH